MRIVAIRYTTRASPGLQVIQHAQAPAPFAGAWAVDIKATPLIEAMPKAEVLQRIADANARFNGDYDRKIGMTREEYIYKAIFED